MTREKVALWKNTQSEECGETSQQVSECSGVFFLKISFLNSTNDSIEAREQISDNNRTRMT